jgi:hypothetical protein
MRTFWTSSPSAGFASWRSAFAVMARARRTNRFVCARFRTSSKMFPRSRTRLHHSRSRSGTRWGIRGAEIPRNQRRTGRGAARVRTAARPSADPAAHDATTPVALFEVRRERAAGPSLGDDGRSSRAVLRRQGVGRSDQLDRRAASTRQHAGHHDGHGGPQTRQDRPHHHLCWCSGANKTRPIAPPLCARQRGPTAHKPRSSPRSGTR